MFGWQSLVVVENVATNVVLIVSKPVVSFAKIHKRRAAHVLYVVHVMDHGLVHEHDVVM